MSQRLEQTEQTGSVLSWWYGRALLLMSRSRGGAQQRQLRLVVLEPIAADADKNQCKALDDDWSSRRHKDVGTYVMAFETSCYTHMEFASHRANSRLEIQCYNKQQQG